MRKIAPLTLIILFIPLIFQSCGSVEVLSGKEELGYLNGEEDVAFEITYNDTKVGEQPEDDFIEEKVKEKNEDDEGSGDEWKEDWMENKEDVYYPTFKSQLEDYFDDADSDIDLTDEKEEANYILSVNVDRIETGFYGGVVSSPAVLDTRMYIKKIGSEESETVLIVEDARSVEKMTTKNRLRNAYKNTAMHYGRWFRDKLSD